MDRKTFLKKSAGAMLIAIPAYSFIGCSSSDDSDDGGGGQGGGDKNCLDNGTSSSIGSNHGHSLTVSKADVTAGTEKTYNIQGSSGHPHTVTAVNFTALKGNNSISVTSSADAGHTHSVTVSCA